MRSLWNSVFIPERKIVITVFADYASDPFKFEETRLAGGVLWDYSLAGRWSTQMHLEYQYIEREIVELE